MEKDRECPNCGSTEVIPSLRVIDQGDGVQPLSLMIEEKPHAAILRGWRRFPLTAWVCGNCGYTELHVADPAGLREAHQRAQATSAAFMPVVGAASAERSARVVLVVALSLTLLIGLGMLAVFLVSIR